MPPIPQLKRLLPAPARRASLPSRHPLAVGRQPLHVRQRRTKHTVAAAPTDSAQPHQPEGPATDFGRILSRLVSLGAPYWTTSEVANQARWRLALVVFLTLATTGVSVLFNFLGRDFFNALSDKNVEAFTTQLIRYLAGFLLGIPVFVFREYYKSKLALEWRDWMTQHFMSMYFKDRTFYQIQNTGGIDNPDQRISSDISTFTDTALSFSLTMLNAAVDLISFSGILFTIYPPLFATLVVYALGGTAITVVLGKDLVRLSFLQEAREADFRYNLVRVRENAESIAFYRGEANEVQALVSRLTAVVTNYAQLLIASRNLDFFKSFYRYLIQLLPAAVVAPLFFQGKIEFGIITQSQSAFGHILGDVSLVVYSFETLAGFGAIVDRLGQFMDVMEGRKADSGEDSSGSSSSGAGATASAPAGQEPAVAALLAAAARGEALAAAGAGAVAAAASSSSSSSSVGSSSADQPLGPTIRVECPPDAGAASSSSLPPVLVELEALTVMTPGAVTKEGAAGRNNGTGGKVLVQDLSLKITPGDSTLVAGPSGVGKTSIMRALAGLWTSGSGTVRWHVSLESGGSDQGVAFFSDPGSAAASSSGANGSDSANGSGSGSSGSGSGTGTSSSGSSGAGGNGAGARPLGRRVLFLPQRPYMLLGSLRDQLLYPTWLINRDSRSAGPPPSDEELIRVLKDVNLEGLLQRCARDSSEASALDAVEDWSHMLSLGEQQRMAFARLVLSRPAMALLDEATSALDMRNEEKLYGLVAAAGITVVSIGHRPSLSRYHKQLLQLKPSEPVPNGAAGGSQHGNGNGNGGKNGDGNGSTAAGDAAAPMCTWRLLPMAQYAAVNAEEVAASTAISVLN